VNYCRKQKKKSLNTTTFPECEGKVMSCVRPGGESVPVASHFTIMFYRTRVSIYGLAINPAHMGGPPALPDCREN